MLEDRNGNIWFASHNEGVARFDGEQFTYYTVDDGLSHNQIRSLRMSPDGTVWFEGGYGLSSYDGEKIRPRTDKDYASPDDWQLDASDVWFKGVEEYGFNALEGRPGAYRWDGSALRFLAFPPLPQWDDEEASIYYSVTDIARGKDGRVWFATYGAVIGFDGEAFTAITNESLGLNEDKGFLHVRSVHEDRNGNLWIGNNGIGVLLYDGKTTINFTDKFKVGKPETAGASASLHKVFSIAEDSVGNVWFGTYESGAWRYDGDSLTHFGPEDGLPSGQVWGIHENQRGELLFLSADPSGVFKFNGTTFEQVY